VLQTGERSLVFVRGPDGALVPRDVRVGLATGGDVEIVSGLSDGEVVVSSANFLIDAESNLAASVGARRMWGDSGSAGASGAGSVPAGATGPTPH
jgi:Cu(I)/Ag(I) efflux system membrane fusion protein